MFIETHIIQNFAPSNLNRDDTGSPKTTVFGGVRRARISSQCIKRSVRMHPAFRESTQVEPAVRTRWFYRLLMPALFKNGRSEEEIITVAGLVAECYSKLKDPPKGQPKDQPKDQTAVLLYFSQEEIAMISSLVDQNWDKINDAIKKDKEKQENVGAKKGKKDDKATPQKFVGELMKNIMKHSKERTSAPDIALFGRMLAEKPDLNMNAAMQVAHAISTHRVEMEADYFTAVDDLNRKDEQGAGMISITPFNSACFYRYSCLDWELLLKNLDNDTALAKKTVEGFLKASVQAIPTGKQSSFAHQNLPEFVLGVVRRDGQAWSLANAFETPVFPTQNGGLINSSIKALVSYLKKLMTIYGDGNIQFFILTLPEIPFIAESPLSTIPHLSLNNWVDQMAAAITEG